MRLLVSDFDKAIDFYVKRLGLLEIESDRNAGTHRVVSLNLARHCENFVLILSSVSQDDSRRTLVGKQWGDAIGVTLPVDNIEEIETRLNEWGVEIVGRQRTPLCGVDFCS